jgi:hypothetical protein
MAANRVSVVATLLAIAASSCFAQFPEPLLNCKGSNTHGCISRFLPIDFEEHAAGARLQPVDGGEPLCIPPRFLELWDKAARMDSENACHLGEGDLEPLGRYFGCVGDGGGSECPRPDIGITLEGGGSKSSPFSLGVLAGLERSGILARTQVVGSTSGGTYAAYYYFARILDRTENRGRTGDTETEWFRDCMPSMYRGIVDPHLKNRDLLRFCEEERGGDFIALVPGNTFMQQVPYQYQVKVGQDLFSPIQTLDLRAKSYLSEDWLQVAGLVGILLTAQIATMPAHWIAHGVFDEPLNFAPSREEYRAGIERAYGHSRETWQSALDREDLFQLSYKPGDEKGVGSRYRRPWSLDELKSAYDEAHAECAKGSPCGFPLWVLSTSSSPGRSSTFWIEPQPRDTLRFAYEIGPHGQGSGLLGFLDTPPHGMKLRDAVGISAAFLDDQQRAMMSNLATEFLVSAGVFALNLEWGTNVENFNTTDSKRTLYHFLPWPIYWAPQFQGLQAPYVRLSDGGNVDNLGLVALLRRGVRNIVISASTDDREGAFPSLCKMKNELELELSPGSTRSTYSLEVPSLEGFGKLCTRQLDRQEIAVWGVPIVRSLFCARLGIRDESQCTETWRNRADDKWMKDNEVRVPTGYDVWTWPRPVLDGCVFRRPDASKSVDDGSKEDPCVQARREGREISRLLIIKPAIDQDRFAEQLKEGYLDSCWWENDDTQVGIGDPPPKHAGMDLPCVTLAFLRYNAPERALQCKHSSARFPQDNFFKMTLNSSYTLFGAYYDLGRHYAGQIVPCADGTVCVRNPSEEKVRACYKDDAG